MRPTCGACLEPPSAACTAQSHPGLKGDTQCTGPGSRGCPIPQGSARPTCRPPAHPVLPTPTHADERPGDLGQLLELLCSSRGGGAQQPRAGAGGGADRAVGAGRVARGGAALRVSRCPPRAGGGAGRGGAGRRHAGGWEAHGGVPASGRLCLSACPPGRQPAASSLLRWRRACARRCAAWQARPRSPASATSACYAVPCPQAWACPACCPPSWGRGCCPRTTSRRWAGWGAAAGSCGGARRAVDKPAETRLALRLLAVPHFGQAAVARHPAAAPARRS